MIAEGSPPWAAATTQNHRPCPPPERHRRDCFSAAAKSVQHSGLPHSPTVGTQEKLRNIFSPAARAGPSNIPSPPTPASSNGSVSRSSTSSRSTAAAASPLLARSPIPSPKPEKIKNRKTNPAISLTIEFYCEARSPPGYSKARFGSPFATKRLRQFAQFLLLSKSV